MLKCKAIIRKKILDGMIVKVETITEKKKIII